LHRILVESAPGVHPAKARRVAVSIAKPPKVQSREIEIITIEQAQKILQRLRGRALYPIIALALATGMPCAS
jgi:hypothetical protein